MTIDLPPYLRARNHTALESPNCMSLELGVQTLPSFA